MKQDANMSSELDPTQDKEVPTLPTSSPSPLSFTIPSFCQPGITLFLFPHNYSPQTNWVHQYISWRRTYKEWFFLLDGIRGCTFPSVPSSHPSHPYIPNTVPDPWYHREVVADILEESLRVNQWFRLQMKRLWLGWRRQVMRRRIVGATDVATMEEVPPCHRIEVYDWSTRACYQFHARTMHSQIIAALRYQTMAISSPKWPKNPYTNIPWSPIQLRHLVEQIVEWQWRVGRQFPDPALQAFYQAGLCLRRFEAVYGFQLELECAYEFFKTPTCDAWEYVYNETLTDIIKIVKPARGNILERAIMDRSLSADLLEAWDDTVIQFWCFENLQRILPKKATSIYDLIVKTRDLIRQTEVYIEERMEESRQKRRRVR